MIKRLTVALCLVATSCTPVVWTGEGTDDSNDGSTSSSSLSSASTGGAGTTAGPTGSGGQPEPTTASSGGGGSGPGSAGAGGQAGGGGSGDVGAGGRGGSGGYGPGGEGGGAGAPAGTGGGRADAGTGGEGGGSPVFQAFCEGYMTCRAGASANCVGYTYDIVDDGVTTHINAFAWPLVPLPAVTYCQGTVELPSPGATEPGTFTDEIDLWCDPDTNPVHWVVSLDRAGEQIHIDQLPQGFSWTGPCNR